MINSPSQPRISARRDQTAPYRADQVGSLLRPGTLRSARAAHRAGRLGDEELRGIEDECIRDVVRKQQELGMKAVTDGEFRRSWWQFDFLAGLDGVELISGEGGFEFHGVKTKAERLAVNGRVGFSGHPMIEHFRFLNDTAAATPKFTIPAPAVLHFRGGRQSISRDVYPDLDAFFQDTTDTYRKVLDAFYRAGCRYLQFDDTVWAYLCSEKELAGARERGDDPEPLPRIYAEMIKGCLAGKPDDMVVTTHVCRGNFRSSWISEGGYEPIAEVLLGDTGYDGYFLEYDSERAGGFEPLRFLPRGKQRVVLGLITTKSGELESRDAILRRVEEASKFVDPAQLCISPQCGFASTEEGNLLSEAEQWDKLRLVLDVATELWGDA